MTVKYTIHIENFEGPFDLLFHLIEKNKIDIYDIPIAIITGQYLEYLDSMKEFDLEIASDFLVMAATLIHIKSKMLLPKQKEAEEESEDPREDLVARLFEYKMYKEFAIDLKEREGLCNKSYYKLPDIIQIEETKTQLIGLSGNDLYNAFRRIVERNVNAEKHNENAFSKIIHREKISVHTKIRSIVRLLKNNDKIEFSNLFESGTKNDMISTFLAILELIKLKRVVIEQSQNFGDIIIYRSDEYKQHPKDPVGVTPSKS